MNMRPPPQSVGSVSSWIPIAFGRNLIRKSSALRSQPEAVRTDRGGAFIAFSKEVDFGRFLKAEFIDHIVGRPYSPRGGGKVESAIGTLRRELWDVFHFQSRAEADSSLTRFFTDYNERRAQHAREYVVTSTR
jgi:transposase InsO family protein